MFPSQVIIAGSTGLIGSSLASMMAGSPAVEKVKLVTRRPTGIKGQNIEEIEVDFEQLDKASAVFSAVAAYCCLGTTMKQAGSKEAFYKVDHDFVVSFAEKCRDSGVNRFFLISAMGASPSSSIFYNKVKGETERDVLALGFREVRIFRPSLLLGDRDERRIGESIGKFLMTTFEFLLIGPLRKYRAIKASVVAHAMMKLSEVQESGSFIYESERIQKLGKA